MNIEWRTLMADLLPQKPKPPGCRPGMALLGVVEKQLASLGVGVDGTPSWSAGMPSLQDGPRALPILDGSTAGESVGATRAAAGTKSPATNADALTSEASRSPAISADAPVSGASRSPAISADAANGEPGKHTTDAVEMDAQGPGRRAGSAASRSGVEEQEQGRRAGEGATTSASAAIIEAERAAISAGAGVVMAVDSLK